MNRPSRASKRPFTRGRQLLRTPEWLTPKAWTTNDMPTHYLPPRRGACKDAAALERVLGLLLWLGLCFVLVGA